MKNKNLPVFLKKTKNEWFSVIGLGIAVFLGLYFSISFSVVIAQGKTLFGSSSNLEGNVELSTTNTDLVVLSLFWILTILLLALFVYVFFFKKRDETKPVRKEIVDGRTVVVKEKEEK